MLVNPWIPPAEPSLGRLAMEAADAEGLRDLRSWPEVLGNGVAFGDLPTFLCWTGWDAGHQLVLLQARELGALVPGARAAGLPEHWLRDLDISALARPMQRHPHFMGGVGVHVLRVAAPGEAWVRSSGGSALTFLRAVLSRLTGIEDWRILPEESTSL